MDSYRGRVSKIKILPTKKLPLVYFKLDEHHCLIAAHSLNFLADVSEGSRLAVCGTINQRNQLIVRKYTVLGKPQILIELETSRYPRRKV